MKCKVLIGFKDKYTGFKYEKGKTYDFTEERVKEILSYEKGVLIKKVSEPKKKEETKKRTTKK